MFLIIKQITFIFVVFLGLVSKIILKKEGSRLEQEVQLNSMYMCKCQEVKIFVNIS